MKQMSRREPIPPDLMIREFPACQIPADLGRLCVARGYVEV